MADRISWVVCVVAVSLFFLGTLVRAEDRFVDNGDGTVTDRRLGVMWAKSDNQGDIDWQQAFKWTRYTFPDLIPTRYDNWRMPTLEELQSLYNAEKEYPGYETSCGRRIKIFPAIRLTCGWVWSSERISVSARVFNYHRGYHYTDRISHSRGYRALPVRNLDGSR